MILTRKNTPRWLIFVIARSYAGIIRYTSAGEAGIVAKRTLDRDMGAKNKVLAFIDDSSNKQGKKLEGVNILHPDKLDVNRIREEITGKFLTPFIPMWSIMLPLTKMSQ